MGDLEEYRTSSTPVLGLAVGVLLAAGAWLVGLLWWLL